ncbi:MAG: DUF2927 domain-containing protein [Gammaproteobacteria bacterium]|nr:DUF2927 domain-containing protein [Gammaproteobacteria bacterium]
MKNYFTQSIKSLVCLIIACTASFNSQARSWQSSDYIKKSFYEVSLGSEYGDHVNNGLRKWQQPLRIYVEHQVPDKALHQKLLSAQISHLAAITQLDIQLTNNKAQANVHYYFTNQAKIKPLVAKNLGAKAAEHLYSSVCIASIKTNNKNHIIFAYVFIPVDLARFHGKLISCIVEEITQALGLVRDSDLVFPSIFNDRSNNALLTGLDEILLRLLSEDSLKAGMTKKQLDPLLNAILKRYHATGLIKSAQQRVIKGKLYQMLGYRRAK